MAKIVVVDDEPTARIAVAAGVQKLGHSAIQCRDGRRAWEVLEDNPDVSMLITDVVMPAMDGVELLRRVRGEERLEGLPILVLSGRVGPREIARHLERGATAFLPKPVALADLRNHLQRNLAAEGRAR